MMNFVPVLLSGIGVGLMVAAPIGPMGVLCIQRTCASGLKAGLATGMGAATVHLLFGSVAAFGLSAAMREWLAQGAQALSLISASLLFWFAARILHRKVVIGLSPLSRESVCHLYLSAVVFGLSNPVTLLLFAAALPALVLPSDAGQGPIIVSGIFLGSVGWWVSLSSVAALARDRLSVQALMFTNKMSGLALAGLGALMLASALGEAQVLR
jgi:threonine/homoserine/homoserine lactone efflux protein